MKKTIIRVVAITIIATVLAIPGASAASTKTTPTEALDPVKLFPFTLTPEELLAVLAEQGIEIIYPVPNPEPGYYYEPGQIGEDGRRTDSTGALFWYECEGIMFVFFTYSEKMSRIVVTGDRFVTPEGVRVGDSRNEVNETYCTFHRIIGGIRERLELFSISGKVGYDAKTKDGYYRFSFGSDGKRCGPLDSWKFYNDRSFQNYDG